MGAQKRVSVVRNPGERRQAAPGIIARISRNQHAQHISLQFIYLGIAPLPQNKGQFIVILAVATIESAKIITSGPYFLAFEMHWAVGSGGYRANHELTFHLWSAAPAGPLGHWFEPGNSR